LGKIVIKRILTDAIHKSWVCPDGIGSKIKLTIVMSECGFFQEALIDIIAQTDTYVQTFVTPFTDTYTKDP
jgi:hypothetical protein